MARTPSTMLPLGTPMPDFALPDAVTSELVHARDLADAPALVVAFWCNHCPFVKHVADAFVAFAREAQQQGAAVVAISANDAEAYPDDAPDAMALEAKARGFSFPYLFDESQQVAKAFHAACTPDFFLFDADSRLAYRGQFDASRPGNDVPVTGNDLRGALRTVLEGQSPDAASQRPSLGCNIKWKPGNEPAYFNR
jgi:peroxiredoxin